jgi:hypothetical protein
MGFDEALRALADEATPPDLAPRAGGADAPSGEVGQSAQGRDRAEERLRVDPPRYVDINSFPVICLGAAGAETWDIWVYDKS